MNKANDYFLVNIEDCGVLVLGGDLVEPVEREDTIHSTHYSRPC